MLRACYAYKIRTDSASHLLCRQCTIPAEGVYIDGDLAEIRCPKCGVSLRGEAAADIFRQQAIHFGRKQAQDMLRRAFRGGKTMRYKPATLHDPGGPFVIG